MRIHINSRLCAYLLLSILMPLLMTGCSVGFLPWEKGGSPIDPEAAAPAAEGGQETGKRPSTEPQATEKKTPGPFQSDEEKNIPGQIIPQYPEALVSPAMSPPGQDVPLPTGAAPPVAVRRESTARPADFSYRDALLTEDVAWHGEVLIEGGVTVAPQATLTVQSGTVVRFRGSAGDGKRAVLVVQGRLVVSGTADGPVIFRSLYESAGTGDWQGLVLLASGKKNLLENCRVEGAETGLDATFSTVTMKNVFFAKCRSGARLQDCIVLMTGGGAGECGTGVTFYDCEADLRSAEFYGNLLGILAVRTSLAVSGCKCTGNNSLALSADKCRLNIAGNSFIGNGSGLGLSGSEGAVTANRIAQNAAYGLVLSQSRVKVGGNDIERNAKAGLKVEDGRGVAWGNLIFANGDFDLYNAGTEEFRAIGNWWGEESVNIAGRIYDKRVDEGRGRVLYLPALRQKPVLETP